MENTLENKAKFFAQYWTWIYEGESVCVTIQDIQESDFLRLKPLSKISDEDAIEIANRIGYFFDKVVRSKKYLYITDKYNDFEDVQETLRIYHNGEIFYLDQSGKVRELSMEQAEEVISLIRQKGIAYQSRGLSVEQQLEYNWIKLTE
ncbi:hypothetical protein [Christiangramia forsetii]|uniref:Uncharacterized protein n=2 Tax=Christiangramia forsetii TaxID=411153 RepID=A0M473_CHRFK|nr:hypothetical protein [Christiangramia forsetii]GGG24080.1 hypothetical protein GCM10011532_04130 [Christiangramia forsetii]CAL67418.1 hypothetical protein GFO_2462 [Christiangramia forsetii KT0803]